MPLGAEIFRYVEFVLKYSTGVNVLSVRHMLRRHDEHLEADLASLALYMKPSSSVLYVLPTRR